MSSTELLFGLEEMQLLLVERGLISSICSAGDLCNGSGQGCNFWKLIGGAERGNMLKVPSKSFMETDFTSYLINFLRNIVGAQLNIGGAQALPKRYKVTPMAAGDVKQLVEKFSLERTCFVFVSLCLFGVFFSIDKTVRKPAWSSDIYFVVGLGIPSLDLSTILRPLLLLLYASML